MLQMKIEILNLIREYLKTSKSIDENYIVRLIGIIVKYRHLEDYVDIDKTEFKIDGKTPARYFNKKIYFDLKVHSKLSSTLSSQLFTNSAVIDYLPHILAPELVSHETEHANHERLILKPQANPRNKILAKSCSLTSPNFEILSDQEYNALSPDEKVQYISKMSELNESLNLYRRFHKFAPEERLAYLYEFRFVISLLRTINREEGNILKSLDEFYRWFSLNLLLQPYKDLFEKTKFGSESDVSPTLIYLTLLGCKNLRELIVLEKDLDLNRRFNLGLSLSQAEFEHFSKISEELESKVSFK